MASTPRHLKPYVKAAEAAGWLVETRKNGHVYFVPPKGTKYGTSDELAGPVKASATPSDRRAMKNMVADLRRRGLEVS